MATDVGHAENLSTRTALVEKLASALDDIALLVRSARHSFSSLQKENVPQTAGLYAIYQEHPFEALYVGKARTRKEPSVWVDSDGLRFRIMENHLGYKGNDNFFRYVKEAFNFSSQSQTREHLKNCCLFSGSRSRTFGGCSCWSISQLPFCSHDSIAAKDEAISS